MIGLEHYLAVAAALFVIGIFGLFLKSQKYHYFVDEYRIDAAEREYQLRRLFGLS